MSIHVRTLRRQLPEQVVLVHGLFSNGAFWIPWLELFSRFQVTLVGVDYAALLGEGATLAGLAAQIDELVGDKPAHLVAHSFGCWPSAASSKSYLSRSFICPTFAAVGFDTQGFCAEVARRLGVDAPQEQAAIASVVDQAIGYKARYADALRLQPSDRFYLPSDDPYFRWVERVQEGQTHAVEGGHFDVSMALAAIAAGLAERPEV